VKKSTKIILAVIGVVGVTALVLPLLLFSYLFGDMCRNEVDGRYASPDGRHELVVFNRSCGATTSFSTQASLLEVGHELPNDSGNLFVADTNRGEAPTGELRVRWDGPRFLTLSYHEKCQVFLAEKERNGVRVWYVTFR
jgi:hypothetical protein